jgi:hypothetical protein
LATWELPSPGFGGRLVRANHGIPVITLNHPSDISIGFEPVRLDGGPVMVTLGNGKIISRADGYRFKSTISWTNMNSSDMQELIQIFDWRLIGSIYLRPHNDIFARYKVIPTTDFDPSLTGNLYIAHDVTITFLGVDILNTIPSSTGDLDGGEMLVF